MIPETAQITHPLSRLMTRTVLVRTPKSIVPGLGALRRWRPIVFKCVVSIDAGPRWSGIVIDERPPFHSEIGLVLHTVHRRAEGCGQHSFQLIKPRRHPVILWIDSLEGFADGQGEPVDLDFITRSLGLLDPAMEFAAGAGAINNKISIDLR